MKMEFGEDAENAEPSEEVGLAARLTKKTKTQAKEKGKNGWNDMKTIIGQTWVDDEFCSWYILIFMMYVFSS